MNTLFDPEVTVVVFDYRTRHVCRKLQKATVLDEIKRLVEQGKVIAVGVGCTFDGSEGWLWQGAE